MATPRPIRLAMTAVFGSKPQFSLSALCAAVVLLGFGAVLGLYWGDPLDICSGILDPPEYVNWIEVSWSGWDTPVYTSILMVLCACSLLGTRIAVAVLRPKEGVHHRLSAVILISSSLLIGSLFGGMLRQWGDAQAVSRAKEDMYSIKQVLEEYRDTQGKYPPRLNQMVPDYIPRGLLERLPGKVHYDPMAPRRMRLELEIEDAGHVSRRAWLRYSF